MRYAFDEAVTSLWRGRESGLLSTATIAIALFVLGGFLLVTSNLERLGAELSRAAEMSVYLDDGITDAQKTAVQRTLAPSELISSVEFVSKEDALRRFKQTFADLSSTVDSVGANPLPASFEVRVTPQANAPSTVESLAARLKLTPGVSDVRYDRQWLDRLLGAVGLVRIVGLVLGAILTFAAALTVANVVRLALYARRDELEIMHLVGAPGAYVRGPFIMEGVLQGGLGALLALTVLAGVFLALRSRYLVSITAALNLSTVRFLPLELCALLLIGGMAVGGVGGIVAAAGGVSQVTQS